MKHLTKAALMAALLVAGNAACGDTDEAQQKGGGGSGGTGGTGGDGGSIEAPTWETAEVRQVWRRKGFGHGSALLAHDVDGDGNDEFLLGGRGVALVDPAQPPGATPIWWMDWADNEYDFAYAFRRFDGNGDGVDDILIVNTRRDAYLVDGTTGAPIWHQTNISEFLPARLALLDGDDDGVPDYFPVGQSSVWSGATGEKLYTLPLPKIVSSAVSAELDGEPGVDLIVGVEIDGDFREPPPRDAKQLFAFSKDQLLWDFAPDGRVTAVAAADVDGDGIHEGVAGTNSGWLHVVGAAGEVWSQRIGNGAVLRLAAADVNGDGRDEIFAAFLNYQDARPSRIVAYSPDGERLWSYDVAPIWIESLSVEWLGGEPTVLMTCGGEVQGEASGFAAALDPDPAAQRERWLVEFGLHVWGHEVIERDGKQLVLLTADDARVRAVDAADGSHAWTWYVGDLITAVASGDANGDGITDVVRGDQRGNIHLVNGVDGTGIWSRRLQVPNGGSVFAVAMGDVDGDGVADVAVAGMRYGSAEPGLVELYSNEGMLLWSRPFQGYVNTVAIADLDGDGQAEVLAVENRGVCVVHTLSADGTLLWSTPVATCGLSNYLDVADMDGDGKPDIAYSAPPFLEPPDIAFIEADGTLRWNVELIDTQWVRAVPGGVLTGGGAVQYGGYTGFYGEADGVTKWEHRIEPIPDPDMPHGDPLGNPVYWATPVPDQTGDGVFEVASVGLRNDLYLIDGATGNTVWSIRLESKDLGYLERPAGGPIVYVPETDETPAWLAMAQWSEMSMATRIRAIDLDGNEVGAVQMQAASAWDGAPANLPDGRVGAFFGSGSSLYAVEAARKAD